MRLKRVYVEITNCCNLSCSFCAPQTRKQGFMGKDSFALALKNIKPIANSIYLHVLGEPLLHPLLPEFLAIAHHFGISVNITTNSSLLTQKSDSLLNQPALRQMNHSLHGFFENGSDGMARLHSVFEFIQKTKNISHCLRLWNISQKENETNQQLLNAIETYFGTKLDLHIQKTIKLAPHVFFQIDEPFSWPQIGLPDICKKGRCLALVHNVGVLWDGTVVPCCLDAHGAIPLGNLFEDDLKTILETSRANSIRKGFQMRNPIEPLCRTCGFLARLNRFS